MMIATRAYMVSYNFLSIFIKLYFRVNPQPHWCWHVEGGWLPWVNMELRQEEFLFAQ